MDVLEVWSIENDGKSAEAGEADQRNRQQPLITGEGGGLTTNNPGPQRLEALRNSRRRSRPGRLTSPSAGRNFPDAGFIHDPRG